MKKQNNGFTLIEIVMVIVLLGIIGSVAVVVFYPIMNLAFTSPKQITTDLVISLTADSILSGDSGIKGLRTIHNLVSAGDYWIDYIDANGTAVQIDWDISTKRFTRTVNSKTETIPVAFPNTAVKIDGQISKKLFKYYDSAGNLLTTPVSSLSAVSRVQMDWISYTGNILPLAIHVQTGGIVQPVYIGSFKNYESKQTINTGVKIYQF
jgi:prepilin-type N-terminal cleavage/methylation domain-containing protein